jgi:hypothetical protein
VRSRVTAAARWRQINDDGYQCAGVAHHGVPSPSPKRDFHAELGPSFVETATSTQALITCTIHERRSRAQHCRQPWRPPTVQNVLLSNAVRVAVLDSECTSVITNRRSSHRCVMSDPARTTSRPDTLCIRPGVRSQYRGWTKSPRRTEPVTGKMLSLSDSEVSCTFVRLLWNPSGCQPPSDGILQFRNKTVLCPTRLRSIQCVSPVIGKVY